MCFELDSIPPIPVIRGAAVSHDDLVLESADGTEFAAYAAAPEEPKRAGVVILPDVRGLYRFYEELALRFAERGYPAVAFDYFGRTAGVAKRDDDFAYMEHVRQTKQDEIQADVAAVVARLRSTCDAIFTGVEHEVVTYADAPHSFFDRRHEAFADESEEAWHRVLAFVERHS